MRERQAVQAQLDTTVRELEAARRMMAEGRGQEAELKRQMEKQMEEEKEKRIEHTKQMALKRIGKRELSKGWTAWLDVYLEHKRNQNLLKNAGAKLTRPKLVACVQWWRRDWEGERSKLIAQKAMSVEDRLRAQLVEAKNEISEMRSRLGAGEGIEAAMQREMDERLEAEREKRIEHTKQMAIARIGKRELSRGWCGWLDMYEENLRRKRALAKAGAKLSKPKLVACLVHWKEDWQEEENARKNRAMGTKLAREMREGAEAKRELELVKRELEELREATRDGRGMEAETQRMLEEKLAAEREKRIEHIQKVATRRLGNKGLSMGWSTWHGMWEENRRLDQMLRKVGGKLQKPHLSAAMQHWLRDWHAEQKHAASMSYNDQLKKAREEKDKLAKDLAYVRAELESVRASAIDGKGMEREIERQMEMKLEKEREKRIEHTKQMAIHRIAKRELSKGWLAWVEPYLEARRRKRLLTAAGARLLKPKKVAGFTHWRVLWQDAMKEQQRLEFQRTLTAKGKDASHLAMELQRTQREYDDRLKLDEVALSEGREAMGDVQGRVRELLEEVAAEKTAAVLAKAKEDKANDTVAETRTKLEHAQQLLTEQQKQAKDHLSRQLADLRKSMETQLGTAQKTIQELKDQLANLMAERVKMQHQLAESAKRPASREKEPTPKEKKEKKPKESGILGKIDFDEDKPLGPQLKEALGKNAVRVLDLFREW